MLIELLILSILLIVAPMMVGTFFTGVDNSVAKLPFRWISGQVLLWAGFQVISIFFILMMETFSKVVLSFNIFTVAITVTAAIYYLAKRSKRQGKLQTVGEKNKWTYALWSCFAVLFIVQIVCAVFLAYEEGDDAFYVAVSNATVNSDQMYRILPYTGLYTELDVRHGLAPFPIWVAYLARMSGMHVTTVAQIVLPVVLIAMAYSLYYCIGKVILSDKQKFLPLYMIITAVMVLYGGYTTYSAENFLLVRSAQGKAVLAAIVIPFLFLLLYLLVEKVQKDEKVGAKSWVLLTLVQTTACLCSTLGTVLTCMLVAIVGFCILICYRKWKLLVPMAVSCIPPAIFAGLYFFVG